MTDSFDTDLLRHVAGATVLHSGPFSSIEVPQLVNSLSREFIDYWVIPFYMANLSRDADKFATAMQRLMPELTSDVYSKLLAEANWRPRIVAANFAAILVDRSMEDQLGKLLLRSDVCFAGRAYCLALARFNSTASVQYLRRYLDHYLERPELFFEQGAAIGAIAYLDDVNGSEVLAEYSARWKEFASDKSEAWELSSQIHNFREQIDAANAIAIQVSSNHN